MPRFIRKNLKEIQYVHITTHGINDNCIYEDTSEKREIRKLIIENQEKFNINIISYCIMSNHLHLLLKIKSPEDLSKYMHKINTCYAIYYNKHCKRAGYVYKDRFYSQIIRNEVHLRNAIVYIHNNPVKAKLCDNAEKYPFSSYNDILNGRIKETMNIFANKKHYIDIHNKDNIEYSVDFEKVTLEEAKIIFNKYLEKNKLKQKSLIYSKKYTYDICKTLKEKYKISYRDLEEITGIGRETIRRLLINKM